MTRDRYRPESLGPFSEWHRNKMPGWYTWIDADYVGYISPNRWPGHAYEPYIVIELIHIRDRDKWGEHVPDRYPLDAHKREMYRELEAKTHIPTFVVWHPTDCDEFVVRRLGGGEITTVYCTSFNDFADILDRQRQKVLDDDRNKGDDDA